MAGLGQAIRGLAGSLALLAQPFAAGGGALVAAGEARPAAQERDGQHDFDFEFGTWKAHLKRRLDPLTGPGRWTELEGTSVVRRVWDGRANLGEIDVSNATQHIRGLSLRLYDPQTRQWSIYWANSRDGSLGPAMVGQFANGRGELHSSFKLEQAFSADGGRTWEPNWICAFARRTE